MGRSCRLLVVVTLGMCVGGCQWARQSPPSPLAGPGPGQPPAPRKPSWEESLVFQPVRWPRGDWQPAGLVFEDARFRSADGTRLHGWYVPHSNPRAVVLY